MEINYVYQRLRKDFGRSAKQFTDSATTALAHKLASLAPITQKASKLALARLLQSNLPDCTDLMRETYNSKDFREGVNAFLEGRSPRWIGK